MLKLVTHDSCGTQLAQQTQFNDPHFFNSKGEARFLHAKRIPSYRNKSSEIAKTNNKHKYNVIQTQKQVPLHLRRCLLLKRRETESSSWVSVTLARPTGYGKVVRPCTVAASTKGLLWYLKSP